MTGTTVQLSHEPSLKRKGTGTRHTEKHQWRKKKKTATTRTKPRQRWWRVRGEEKMGGRTSWAEKKKQHEGKLDAPMNHMIDVASYWACAFQKTADLRHLGRSWLLTSLFCI